jgi:hypothetical protein
VWELKRPGHIDQAVFQSYIYAVTLCHMLRSRSGEDWFKLFGFRGPLPGSLDVESVVLLSDDMRSEYTAQAAKLRAHNAMAVNGDRIHQYVAYYDRHTLQLRSFEEPSPLSVKPGGVVPTCTSSSA